MVVNWFFKATGCAKILVPFKAKAPCLCHLFVSYRWSGNFKFSDLKKILDPYYYIISGIFKFSLQNQESCEIPPGSLRTLQGGWVGGAPVFPPAKPGKHLCTSVFYLGFWCVLLVESCSTAKDIGKHWWSSTVSFYQVENWDEERKFYTIRSQEGLKHRPPWHQDST